MTAGPSRPELEAELEDLRARLAAAEEALRAIREGEVDGVVVTGRHGEQLYTLSGADRAYRQLVETMNEGAVTLSADGVILYCNDRMAKMLERPLDQVMGSTLRNHLPPADQQALAEVLVRARTEPSRREINLMASDGRLVPVYLSASRVQSEGAEPIACLLLTDLTDQKSHEQIVAAEQKLRLVLGQLPIGVSLLDQDRTVTYANHALERTMGVSADTLVHGRFRGRRYVRGDGTPMPPEEFAGARAFRERRPIHDVETGTVTESGETIWTSVSAAPLPEPERGVVVATVDISERKRAEEALRRSEAEYRGLVEQAPLGIYRTTSDGRALRVNQALVTMLGYDSADDLLNVNARDFYADPEERDRAMGQVEHQGEARIETHWKRRDGSLVAVRVNMRLVRAAAGADEYVEGLIEDVTEQRTLESQFRQAQRMEAVGRLAGGVAHDFNNVLTAITGYSDLLLEELEPADPKRRDVEEIKAAGLRAASLTRQLLAFSRTQVLQTRVLDVNGVVRGVEKMLQRLLGEDVKLEVALDTALGTVRADPGQLEQVIVNLAVNSRDAMPGGGLLTIETANVELDAAYAREHVGSSPGRHVMLAVTDTGIGMDAKTRSQVFDPFFTTKEQGKGTGLGLSVVYGIVKQSGGSVWVYSEPERGATFKVYLPRVDEPVEAQEPAPAAPAAAGGTETVLLAEDDPSVREIVADVLTRRGYRVLRAADGQTALEMAAARPGQIDLLVTDLVMPGMTGRQLAEAFAAQSPGVRVLYMSGYTDDAVVRQGVLAESFNFLQKPFTPSALALKVREVLDRP
jgi:PAS domain S-box-containing protein